MQVIKDNYATFAVPYNGEDNNDYVDGEASAAMTAAWKLRRHELCRELQRITSKRATHTRRCSSTTTQTIWVAVVTSPTLTARWCSILRYVPFGEVFVEERNNISNNPLRRERNGKR